MASKFKKIPIAEWNELQKELESLRGDKLSYDSITDALNTELESLRDQLHARETNCKSYSESNAEMRNTFADLNAKYEKLMAEKSELLATITEQKAKCCNLQNSNQSFKAQNHRLQTQNDQFTEELSDSNNKLFKLQQKFNNEVKARNALNVKTRKIQTAKQCVDVEIGGYKSQIEILEQEISHYQQEMTNLKKETNKSLSDQTVEMDALKRKVDSLERIVSTKQKLITNRDETIERLESDHDDLQNKLTETRMKLQHQNLSLQQQIASFKTQCAAQQRRRELAESEKDKVVVQMATLKAEKVKLKEIIKSHEERNKKLVQRIKTIKYDPSQWDIDTAKLTMGNHSYSNGANTVNTGRSTVTTATPTRSLVSKSRRISNISNRSGRSGRSQRSARSDRSHRSQIEGTHTRLSRSRLGGNNGLCAFDTVDENEENESDEFDVADTEESGVSAPNEQNEKQNESANTSEDESGEDSVDEYTPGGALVNEQDINDGYFVETPSDEHQFRRKFVTLCETVRTLWGRIHSLEDIKVELEDELNRLAPSVQRERMEYQQMQQDYVQMQRDNQHMDSLLNQLKEDHNKRSLQYEDMRKKYGSALHERDELRQTIARSLYDRRHLNDGLTAKYMQFDNIRSLLNNHQTLLSCYRAQKEELAEYEKKVGAATAKLNALKDTRQQLEVEKATVREQLTAVTQKIEKMENEKSSKNMKQEMDESPDTFDDEMENMNDVNQSNGPSNGLNPNGLNTDSNGISHGDSRDSLNGMVPSEEILEWKQYAQEREKEHDLYRETKQKQIESLQTEAIKLKNENQAMEISMNDIKKQMDKLKRTQRDLEQMLISKDTEIASLNADMKTTAKEKERLMDDIVQQKDNVIELKQQITLMQNEKRSFNQQIGSFKQIINDLKENINRMNEAQIASMTESGNRVNVMVPISPSNDSQNDGDANKSNKSKKKKKGKKKGNNDSPQIVSHSVTGTVSSVDLEQLLNRHKEKDLQFLTKQNELNKEINQLMVENSNLKRDNESLQGQLEKANVDQRRFEEKYESMGTKYSELDMKYKELQQSKQSDLGTLQQQFQEFMQKTSSDLRATNQSIQQLAEQSEMSQSVLPSRSAPNSPPRHSQGQSSSDVVELRNQIETKTELLRATQNELKSMEQQFTFWKNKAIDYENELKSAESAFDCNLESRTNTNKSLESELEAKETQIEVMQTQISQFEADTKDHNKKMNELKSQMASLKEEIVRMKEAEMTLKSQLEAAVSGKDEAEQSYQEELDEHANALRDIEVKNVEITKLKQEALEKDNTVQQLELEVAKVTRQCKQKESALEKERAEISEKNSFLVEEQSSLNQQIRLISEENERLKMENTSNSMSMYFSDGGLSAASTVTANTNDAAELDAEDIKKLRQCVKDSLKTVNRYKARLSAVNRKLNETELAKERVQQQYDANIKQMAYYKEQLEAQLRGNDVEESASDAAKSKAVLSELENVSAIYESNKLLQDGVTQRDQRIAVLEKENEEREQEVGKLKEEMSEMKGEKAVLQSSHDQMKRELQIMRENHQSIVTKYHKIDPKEYERLTSIENTLKEQLDKQRKSAAAKLVAVQKQLKAAQHRCHEMVKKTKEVLGERDSVIESMKRERTKLTAEVAALKEQIKKKMVKMEEEKAKLEKLEEERKEFVAERQRLVEEKKKLKQQMDSMPQTMKKQMAGVLEKYKSLIQKQKTKIAELEAKSKESDALRVKLNQTQQQLKSARSTGSGSSGAPSSAVHDGNRDILVKRISVMANLLEQKKAVIEKVVGDHKVIQKKFESLSKEMTTKRQTVITLKAEIDSKTKELEAANEYKALQKQENAALQKIITVSKKRERELAEKLKAGGMGSMEGTKSPEARGLSISVSPQLQAPGSGSKPRPKAPEPIQAPSNWGNLGGLTAPAPVTMSVNVPPSSSSSSSSALKLGQKRKRSDVDEQERAESTDNRKRPALEPLEPPSKRQKVEQSPEANAMSMSAEPVAAATNTSTVESEQQPKATEVTKKAASSPRRMWTKTNLLTGKRDGRLHRKDSAELRLTAEAEEDEDDGDDGDGDGHSAKADLEETKEDDEKETTTTAENVLTNAVEASPPSLENVRDGNERDDTPMDGDGDDNDDDPQDANEGVAEGSATPMTADDEEATPDAAGDEEQNGDGDGSPQPQQSHHDAVDGQQRQEEDEEVHDVVANRDGDDDDESNANEEEADVEDEEGDEYEEDGDEEEEEESDDREQEDEDEYDEEESEEDEGDDMHDYSNTVNTNSQNATASNTIDLCSSDDED